MKMAKILCYDCRKKIVDKSGDRCLQCRQKEIQEATEKKDLEKKRNTVNVLVPDLLQDILDAILDIRDIIKSIKR